MEEQSGQGRAADAFLMKYLQKCNGSFATFAARKPLCSRELEQKGVICDQHQRAVLRYGIRKICHLSIKTTLKKFSAR